jgi:hypothetical protein
MAAHIRKSARSAVLKRKRVIADQRLAAVRVTQCKLHRGWSARRRSEDHRTRQAQPIEQRGMRICLRCNGRVVRERRTEVTEARRCDDPVSTVDEHGAKVETLVVTTACAVHDQKRRAFADARVLDPPNARRGDTRQRPVTITRCPHVARVTPSDHRTDHECRRHAGVEQQAIELHAQKAKAPPASRAGPFSAFGRYAASANGTTFA